MRHVKSFLQRYDGDGNKVPLNPVLLGSVKQSHAKHEQTMSVEENASKRKATEQAA